MEDLPPCCVGKGKHWLVCGHLCVGNGKQGDVIYSAVRAVDTATHPSHQGKGIFKKLTLALVDYCKERNDHFVFNTPNQQSKPGYIKMGWQEAGKLPINLTVHRPFNMIRNLINHNGQITLQNNSIKYYLEHPGLQSLIGNELQLKKNIMTNTSKTYLKWRYVDVPVANYIAIGDEAGDELKGLIIGRIKNTRLGNEFRVTDFFLKENCSGEALLQQIKKNRKVWNIDYSTIIGTGEDRQKDFLKKFTLKVPIGPVVTVRPLGLTDLSSLKKFNKWSPSLRGS